MLHHLAEVALGVGDHLLRADWAERVAVRPEGSPDLSGESTRPRARRCGPASWNWRSLRSTTAWPSVRFGPRRVDAQLHPQRTALVPVRGDQPFRQSVGGAGSAAAPEAQDVVGIAAGPVGQNVGHGRIGHGGIGHGGIAARAGSRHGGVRHERLKSAREPAVGVHPPGTADTATVPSEIAEAQGCPRRRRPVPTRGPTFDADRPRFVGS